MARISLAVAAQVNGFGLVFQLATQSRSWLIKTLTVVKVPRRMDWRAMIPMARRTDRGRHPAPVDSGE